MKIHEYQAKKVLAKFGVPVHDGITADNPHEAQAAFIQLGVSVAVIKAQVYAGGRGKGGGVKLVRSAQEAQEVTQKMMSKPLVTPQTGPEGVAVKKVFVCPAVDIEKEYYLGIVMDRSKESLVLIASTEGGMDIEEVARKHPEKILKESIDIRFGLLPFQAKRVAFQLGFSAEEAEAVSQILIQMAKAYVSSDCLMIEINPFARIKGGKFLALDAKISFDPVAMFRHPEYDDMKESSELSESEERAHKSKLSYISLDGNIGCMVNGAGLAMATMDIIKYAGGNPANFLDVGGGVSQNQVTEAFKIILSDPRVKGVLVNIFGGIVHCDLVAKGVLGAVEEIGIKIPLVVRLEGTNVEIGKSLLENSKWNILTASTMKEAAEKIVAATSGKL
ncbi:MAG: ADP-forming succinate--CoA ligase subunit beta [Candidatus Brocadiae bacterium]|nr:ADP-forming succinate--CoA ligase subunit beta [Candidatus Brocadiia bacterium]